MPARRTPWIEVELRGLSLHRDGRGVLHDVDWRIAPGERWALVGPNGAGKTQLLKLVAGAVWPDPAPRPTRVHRMDGETHATPAAVLDEIAYVGPERQDRHERYEWNFRAQDVVVTGLTRSDIPQGPATAAQLRAARRGLAALGIARLARRPFLELSFGERRLVLLARALATRPRLLLMDELLTGLDADNRARLRRWLDAQRRSARPWVLSGHRLEELPRSITHVLSLEEGRVRARGPVGVRPRRAPTAPAVRSSPAPARRRSDAAPLFEVARGTVHLAWRPVLRGIDWRLGAGECWVVHGPNGSGKTTLLRALRGDHAFASGSRVRRRGIVPGVPLSEFQKRVGLLSAHLHVDTPASLDACDTVVSGLRGTIGLDGPSTARERRRALAVLRRLGLADLAPRPFRTLSYGQGRRVLFARALVHAPDLLLLDEPFAGVDAATRAFLRAHLDALHATGCTLVMTTHHRDEWPDSTTHELALRAGRVRYAGAIRLRRRPTRAARA